MSVDGENLVVEIEGIDKIWALKSRLVAPPGRIRAPTPPPMTAPDARHRPRP
ncbi:hypothetical protein M877_39065 [Streptomyces niveus NCIMB 11891]|nr:hypothetical protein M877_39065 [Streptomyces niveus NCIMB 11891]